MPVRSSEAVWMGSLLEGRGTIRLESGSFAGDYSFRSRFVNGKGTNPEELIAAAHAGCYSMALSAGLTRAGHPPTSIRTAAHVYLEKDGEGFGITKIELETYAMVPKISEAEFLEQVEAAKTGCPVSRLLASVEITLSARLVAPG